MSAFERQQALAALVAVVMALFLAAQYPPAARWRRALRRAAILCFLIALGAALVEIVLWLAGR
jgi:phosphotransferase system  glucose/maltose/N-acetylglucosamine-specific IIC component